MFKVIIFIITTIVSMVLVSMLPYVGLMITSPWSWIIVIATTLIVTINTW